MKGQFKKLCLLLPLIGVLSAAHANETIDQVSVQNMSSEEVTLSLNNGTPKSMASAPPASELASGYSAEQHPVVFLRSPAVEQTNRLSRNNCLKVQFETGETKYFHITVPENLQVYTDLSIQLYGNALMLDVRGMGTYFPAVSKSQCVQ